MYDEALQDEILFDRLADGELSLPERERLLASLDDRPGGWRKCALAFLEAQTWRSGLNKIVRESEIPSLVRATAPLPVRTSGRGLWLFATAACVLMAFTLGLAMREDGLSLRSAAPNAGDELVASNNVPPVSNSSPHTSSPRATTADEALTLWVRNEQGQAQPLRVPLVDAAALDRELGVDFRPGLSDTARGQLRERGYEVESKQRYAPLWLENGRPMIVPVEDMKIVPVSQPVY